jgi:hypothetical protein
MRLIKNIFNQWVMLLLIVGISAVTSVAAAQCISDTKLATYISDKDSILKAYNMIKACNEDPKADKGRCMFGELLTRVNYDAKTCTAKCKNRFQTNYQHFGAAITRHNINKPVTTGETLGLMYLQIECGVNIINP